MELETFAKGDPVRLRERYQREFSEWPFSSYDGVVVSASRLLVVVRFGDGDETTAVAPYEIERRG